MTAGPKGNS